MGMRAKRGSGGLVFVAGTILTIVACSDRYDGPTSIVRPPDRPEFYVIEDEADCPPEVPANECVPLSQAERETLYWDIMQGIIWEYQDCFDVGNVMLDFVLYSDIRKWPEQRKPDWWGSYSPPWVFRPSARISLNDKVFKQGWSTDRLVTTMHEGFHHMGFGGGNYGNDNYAETFANYCVNW